MNSHENGKVTRRDILALDRTRLANYRTVLAYMRTVILLAVSGITLIKLFPRDIFILSLGLAFFLLAGFLLVIGIVVYVTTKKKLKSLYGLQTGEKEDTSTGES